MLKNYLTIALRNIRKQKGFSFINIFGLALGMACTILIYSFIEFEVGYDKFFDSSDRIYRARLHAKIGDSEFNLANSPTVLAETLVDEFPQIEIATRITDVDAIYFKRDANLIKEENLLYADSSFFRVFSVEMIHGNPATALNEPHNILLTEESSKKYFDNDNAVGEVLVTDNGEEFLVTGIVKKLPQNSHFNFDFIASMKTIDKSLDKFWLGNPVYTYFLLKEGQSLDVINQKMPEVIRKHVEPQISAAFGVNYDQFLSAGNFFNIETQWLLDIHLTQGIDGELEQGGSRSNIYIFSSISILILLLGCINFVNLATAKTSIRAKEIGVRKVMGSDRKQLIKQFLSESVFLSLNAFIISLALISLLAPLVNEIASKPIELIIWTDPITLLAMFVCAVLVGLISGFYPALIFSGISVINVFREKTFGIGKNSRLRKYLVVFQFSVTTFLIASTIIIYNQLQYMRYKDIGYDRDQIFVISNISQLGNKMDSFKADLKNKNFVVNATISRSLPHRHLSATVFKTEESDQNFASAYFLTDYEFAETFNTQIVEGRYFSKEFATDSSAVVLNEAAVKEFGLTDPIGKRIFSLDDGDNPDGYTIIGVMKSFHIENLHGKIHPVVFALNDPSDRQFLSIKMKGKDARACVGLVEDLWGTFNPGKPVEYFFMDQEFELVYKEDIRIGKLFMSFSFLAILIACLGLFGLVSFSTERRTKEIGIRKTLGASITGILVLLLRSLSSWVIISNIIAIPVAYYFMEGWLSDFAFRVSITSVEFIIAGFLTLSIAVLTSLFQTLKAAMANPVDSLRNE